MFIFLIFLFSELHHLAGNFMEVPVCRFFLNGNCRYGNFCRNSHIIPPEEAATIPTTIDDTIADAVTQPPQDTNNNSYTANATGEVTRNWIDAPEFIPRYITQNTCDTNQASDYDQGASR